MRDTIERLQHEVSDAQESLMCRHEQIEDLQHQNKTLATQRIECVNEAGRELTRFNPTVLLEES